MSNPLTNGNWTAVGTVGTVLVTDRATTLLNIIFPGTYVGTVIFHDAAATAGTTATSSFGTFGLPNTNVGGNILCNIPCKKGLVYQATGTPILTFTWE